MRRIPSVKLISIIILSLVCLFGEGLAQKQIEAQAPKSEPWSPPDLGASSTKAATSSGTIEAGKLPDIIGVHLGMDPKEALAVVRAHYPKNLLTTYDTDMYMFPGPAFQGTIVNPADNHQDDFNFQATLPPEKPVVWKVTRTTKFMHTSHDTLLAALRAKYGKETVGIIGNTYDPARNDAEAATLIWLFDESGKRVPLPNSDLASVVGCWINVPDHPGTAYLTDEAREGRTPANGWCGASFVAVQANVGVAPIVEHMTVDMVDLPVVRRTSHTTAVWWKAEVEKARIRDLEKAKQAKPVL